MRVAFGMTVLNRCSARGTVDGIANYAREVYSRLENGYRCQVRGFTYGGRESAGVGEAVIDFGPFKAQALYSAGTGLSFPVASKRVAGKFDLVHATDHLVPRLKTVPVVATVMDAIPLSHPEWVSYSMRSVKNELWRRSVHWASHVITISEHARDEIVRWFRIPEHRVSITPLGVDRRWFDPPGAERLVDVVERYSLPAHFFLFVGTLQPRKNLLRLIAAHRALPAGVRKEFPLVVVGRAGWGCHEEVAQLNGGDGGALRWLRYVADADLVPLVSSASAMVFPSLCEGFGLPVVEAFAAGVPVITSDSTALRETAGDAAVLVRPESIGEIADAMRFVCANESLASQMAMRGRDRALSYSWERTAIETEKVYERVLAKL